jgi:hypothetical protein
VSRIVIVILIYHRHKPIDFIFAERDLPWRQSMQPNADTCLEADINHPPTIENTLIPNINILITQGAHSKCLNRDSSAGTTTTQGLDCHISIPDKPRAFPYSSESRLDLRPA